MSEERATIAVLQGTYEPCEECGAPLDPQQRYCVNCAARRGNGDNEALLRALRQQEAAAATASTATATPAATANAKASKAGKDSKAPAKGEGKVVAHTGNGDVHSVTDFKASEEKTQQDTQIVAENPEQTGDNYIKAQQNLPDVTVIGGEPGSAPAPVSGVEP